MKPTIKPATASAGPPIRWIYRPLLTLACLALASCVGTFSISPTGVISYTTPEILKAPIVEDGK